MNTANKWTDDEKSFVINKFKDGLSIEDIHKTGKINRSKYAIELKIYGHIYDLLQNGDNYEDVGQQFKKSKKEIKEIEKKIFEMRNKSDNQTQYTNDGGYVLNQNNNTNTNVLDLNDFYNINRTMNAVINYYENISKLNKLKSEKIIDDTFYNDLISKLNQFSFDKNKIINSLIITEKIDEKKLDKTNKSEKTDDSDKIKKKDKKNKTETKIDTESDDESVEIEIPVKKLKKRLL
jgi:hypothetical protein